MSRRNQTIMLGALLCVLAYVVHAYVWPSGETAKPPATDVRFTPVNVENPALRMDILQRFLNLEYKGVHRNIFSATLPPPPAPPPKPVTTVVAPPVPAAPPPLTVDARYFGYVSDSSGSHRRAFFATNNNEDVFIASEGDTLMGRFRVVRLTNTTADVEEVSSGRRATLVLQEVGPNG